MRYLPAIFILAAAAVAAAFFHAHIPGTAELSRGCQAAGLSGLDWARCIREGQGAAGEMQAGAWYGTAALMLVAAAIAAASVRLLR